MGAQRAHDIVAGFAAGARSRGHRGRLRRVLRAVRHVHVRQWAHDVVRRRGEPLFGEDTAGLFSRCGHAGLRVEAVAIGELGARRAAVGSKASRVGVPPHFRSHVALDDIGVNHQLRAVAKLLHKVVRSRRGRACRSLLVHLLRRGQVDPDLVVCEVYRLVFAHTRRVRELHRVVERAALVDVLDRVRDLDVRQVRGRVAEKQVAPRVCGDKTCGGRGHVRSHRSEASAWGDAAPGAGAATGGRGCAWPRQRAGHRRASGSCRRPLAAGRCVAQAATVAAVKRRGAPGGCARPLAAPPPAGPPAGTITPRPRCAGRRGGERWRRCGSQQAGTTPKLLGAARTVLCHSHASACEQRRRADHLHLLLPRRTGSCPQRAVRSK